MSIGEQIAVKKSRWQLAMGFLAVFLIIAFVEAAVLCAVFLVSPESRILAASAWRKIWPFGHTTSEEVSAQALPGERALFLDDDVRRMHRHIDRMFEDAMERMEQQMRTFPFVPPSVASEKNIPPRPADHFRYLQRDIDRLFREALQDQTRLAFADDFFGPWHNAPKPPFLELHDNGDHYTAQVKMPVGGSSNFQAKVDGRLLVIRVDSAAHSDDGVAERHYETRIMLPGPVDGESFNAICEDGMLRVRIPKASAAGIKKTL